MPTFPHSSRSLHPRSMYDHLYKLTRLLVSSKAFFSSSINSTLSIGRYWFIIVLVSCIGTEQLFGTVGVTSSAARSVPVRDGRHFYTSIQFVMSDCLKAGVSIVSRNTICFVSFGKAWANDSMNCLWSCALLGETLTESPAVVEDPAWLVGLAQEQAIQPIEPVAEVYWECSVDIFVSFNAVWRWDGESGGELAVIGDLESITCLWVFGRGVTSIDALYEVSFCFCSFLSPASPPLTVFSLSFLPSRL